ncbi:MAG: hypothetical protein LBN99_03745 [Oscillospiraceae bacterium]|jgi:hypothetical protein|nr:hypothetical protein [Oscillospiraceae bacterium]
MAEAALRQDSYIYSSALPEEALPFPQAGEQSAPFEDARAIPRPARKPRISLFSIFGFAFVAALAITCTLSYVELTEVSTDITGIREIKGKVKPKAGITDKLNALTTEYSALRIEYERTFDMNAIERYAIDELGMTRTTAVSERVISAVPEDKAIIPATARNNGGIKEFITSLLAYFK